MSRRRNPSLDGATLVYPEVDKVFATKGDEAGRMAGPYVHTFGETGHAKPAMYGLPGGDLLITSRGQAGENPPKRKRRRSNLPKGFASRLRRHIRSGLSARAAMKRTWRDVRKT